ncbi:unnamed protein product [marine sediment metagenome]|uniref:Phosphate transporter n=1 Tax=marine sediment metagenome TaxID=412755 RepID=X1T830_9ZZZZ
MEILVIAAIIIGLYMAWNIGANDVANSMADAVGSKSLTIFCAAVGFATGALLCTAYVQWDVALAHKGFSQMPWAWQHEPYQMAPVPAFGSIAPRPSVSYLPLL